MLLLKFPNKVPEYQQGRDHLEFVMRLKDVFSQREHFLNNLCAAGEQAGFDLQEATLGEASAAMAGNKVFGTKLEATLGETSVAMVGNKVFGTKLVS
eukprot:gene89-3696_t